MMVFFCSFALESSFESHTERPVSIKLLVVVADVSGAQEKFKFL